jgi:hypothetical protein
MDFSLQEGVAMWLSSTHHDTHSEVCQFQVIPFFLPIS